MFSKPEENYYDYKQVSALVYEFLTARKHKLKAFIVNIANINKAVAEKKFTNPKTRLPD